MYVNIYLETHKVLKSSFWISLAHFLKPARVLEQMLTKANKMPIIVLRQDKESQKTVLFFAEETETNLVRLIISLANLVLLCIVKIRKFYLAPF